MFVGLCFLLTSLFTVCFGVTAVETHDRRGGVLFVCLFSLRMVKQGDSRFTHSKIDLAARSTKPHEDVRRTS